MQCSVLSGIEGLWENTYPYSTGPDSLQTYAREALYCMVQENRPAAVFGSPPFLTPIHKTFREAVSGFLSVWIKLC